MMTQLERRAISAAWRVLSSTGDERIRALQRLTGLVGFVVAFDVWLRTDPDPVAVEQVITTSLLAQSPLRDIVQVQPHVEVS